MIITRDQVKEYLGITDTSYDDRIDLFIPVVDKAVKSYTGYDWDTDGTGTITFDSKIINVSSIERDLLVYFGKPYSNDGYSNFSYNDNYRTSTRLTHYLLIGQLVTGTGVPADSYIESINDKDLTITITNTATADGTDFNLGFSNEYYYTVSKMIAYLISNQSVNLNPIEQGISAQSYGKTSLSFGGKGSSGSSQRLINGIPVDLYDGMVSYVSAS